MSIETHIDTLNFKHGKLENTIDKAYVHHLPEEDISKLKKEKLMIKDEINNLQHLLFDEDFKEKAA